MVLDEPAAEGTDQTLELDEFEPAFASELFAMIDGEDDLGPNAMGSQPGDGPEIEAESIGPGAFARVGNELEPRGDIQSAPLEVGDLVAVQMPDLLASQSLKIPDIFQVRLDDFEGLCRVPIDELSFLRASETASFLGYKAVLITAEDIADGRPGDGELLVLGEINVQAFGAEVSLVFGLDHSILDPTGSLARLTMRSFGSIAQISFGFFAKNIINNGSVDAEKPSCLCDVVPIGPQVIKHGPSGSFGVDFAELFVVDLSRVGLDKGSRFHGTLSFRFLKEIGVPMILAPALRTPDSQIPNCV